MPDHSTISQLRRRKSAFRKVFRRLFEETDSTHVKANAFRTSEYLVDMQEEAGVYWERLNRYEEEGLAELERRTGKRRKKRTNQKRQL